MLRPASSNAPSWLRQRSLVAWAHGNNGLRGAAFSFLGNVLSSSVLGLPSCFRRCGWLLATLLLVGVAATQMFTLKALVFVSALRQRGSYEGLTEASLGRAARVACTLCVLLLQAGSLVALLELLADLLVASVSPLMPPGADVGRVHVMSALCFGVLLPLCALVRGEEAMSQASVVSVVFLCGFTAATMGIAFFPSATNVKEGAPPGPLALWRPQGVALSLPVIIFALTGHSALFPCLAAMKSPTVTRADALLLGSTRAATLIYAAVGVAGYFTFREATAGTLLRNLSEVERLGAPERAAVLALKLGFALSTAGAVPITLLPVRDAALAALRGSSGAEEEGAVLLPQGFLAHSALCGALLGCCLLAAVAMPNVEVVFALTGATASVALAYVLPCACFLATSGRAEPPPRPAPAAAQLRGLPPAAAPEAEAEDVLWASQAAADAEAEVEQWAEHGARTDAELFGCLAGAPARALAAALLLAGCAAMWLCTQAALREAEDESEVVELATELVAKSGAAVRAAQALGSAAQAACSLTLAGADGGHACDLRRRLHLPRIFRRSRWGLGSAAAAARGGDRLPHAHPHLPLGGAAALLSSSGAATAAGEELAQALSSAQAAGAEAHVAPALVARVHDAARDVAAYASLPGDAAPGAGAANASVALAAAEELADATVAAVHNAVAAHAPGTATRAAELASLLLPSSEKRDELAAALDVATQAAPKGLGEAGGLLLARLNHTARGGAHRT